MEWKDGLTILSLIVGLGVNAFGVFKGIKHLSTKMIEEFGKAAKDAVVVHRTDAQETESRFQKLERGMEKLQSSQDGQGAQLGRMEEMMSEVREALFSMIKK